MNKLLDYVKAGKTYIIAEMSANHAGSLDTALEIVGAAKEAGADCLKIQTYTADTMTLDCDGQPFRITDGGLWDGRVLHELYEEASLPWKWQPAIKEACEKAGIDFLSTPFDATAVDFLEELGCDAYKIASFELVDIPLIEYTASKGKPMIISCGMGTIEDIERALNACEKVGNDKVVILKCCSEYPANWLDMHLSNINDMEKRFKVPVGLSDHSMGNLAALIGVSMGAVAVEKHFCLSRKIKNPDSEFSMEPSEFAEMVTRIREVEQIKGDVRYGPTDRELSSMRFRRSLFAKTDIQVGERFSNENICCVRPSDGLAPRYLPELLDKPSKRSYKFGDPILECEIDV